MPTTPLISGVKKSMAILRGPGEPGPQSLSPRRFRRARGRKTGSQLSVCSYFLAAFMPCPHLSPKKYFRKTFARAHLGGFGGGGGVSRGGEGCHALPVYILVFSGARDSCGSVSFCGWVRFISRNLGKNLFKKSPDKNHHVLLFYIYCASSMQLSSLHGWFFIKTT